MFPPRVSQFSNFQIWNESNEASVTTLSSIDSHQAGTGQIEIEIKASDNTESYNKLHLTVFTSPSENLMIVHSYSI